MNDTPPTPSRAMIMEKLQAALARVDDAAPTASEATRLREDLGLDSFAAIELMFEIEDLLDVRIPQPTAIAFQTVGDVVAFLSAELAKREAPATELASGARGT